jgi:hypothetical protein
MPAGSEGAEQVDTSAYGSANLWSRMTFNWSGDLVREANKRDLKEGDASYLMAQRDMADQTSREFDEMYARLKVCGALRG